MNFNYTSNEIRFYAVLRQRGLLNQWILFDKLKYRNVVNGVDLGGGKVPVAKLKEIATQIGVNYNTLRQAIMVMFQEGWIYKTPSRKSYVLKSWKRVAKCYSLTFSKFRLKANNNQELTKKIALDYIDRTIRRQVYQHRVKNDLSTHKKILLALQKDKEFSVSVRQVAQALGFKSAMTGSRKLKELLKDKLISIEKIDRYVCELSDYGLATKVDETLCNRSFIKDNAVYERQRSNIIVLETPTSSKQRFITKLLKIANDKRKMNNNYDEK